MTFTTHELLNKSFARFLAKNCKNCTIILKNGNRIKIKRKKNEIITSYNLPKSKLEEEEFEYVMLQLG